MDKLNLKIFLKMLSQIGLIHIFCSPYLPAATGFLFLSSLSNQVLTNKQLSCLADSHKTHWFELLYKIPLILYCKQLTVKTAGVYKQNFEQKYTLIKSHSILNVDNYLNLISKY